MKKLLFSLLLISTSAFSSDNVGCKDSMADWLNSYHTVEQKEVLIKKYCSDFEGDYKDLSSCLEGAYTWNNSKDLDHRYEVALLSCSKVSRKLLDTFSKSFGRKKTLRAIATRTKKCLEKEWNNHSYIFNADARRINAASICSEELE